MVECNFVSPPVEDRKHMTPPMIRSYDPNIMNRIPDRSSKDPEQNTGELDWRRKADVLTSMFVEKANTAEKNRKKWEQMRDILPLVLRGEKQTDIAKKLGMTTPTVTRRVAEIRGYFEKLLSEEEALYKKMTKIEWEVFRLCQNGHTNAEIAQKISKDKRINSESIGYILLDIMEKFLRHK